MAYDIELISIGQDDPQGVTSRAFSTSCSRMLQLSDDLAHLCNNLEVF
jgi:hypothetical protein